MDYKKEIEIDCDLLELSLSDEQFGQLIRAAMDYQKSTGKKVDYNELLKQIRGANEQETKRN